MSWISDKLSRRKSFRASNELLVTKNFFILKKAEEIAEKVLDLLETDEYQNIKGKQFKRRTADLKKRILEGTPIDDLIVEAFALSYLAINEVYGLKLYKVQLMGSYILHKGDVAEMKTGEGKTITAIPPTYLNALTGKGVHIVTVNEYLSTRDSFNTGKVFSLMGLSTGSIISEQSPDEKRVQYAKDIAYVTNSEVGFDYLRDNMVKTMSEKTQRGFHYAIIDEVDSILIDEARTPLIISGGQAVKEGEYIEVDLFVKTLRPEDYTIDRETKQVYLNPVGIIKTEKNFKLDNLFSNDNAVLVHRMVNALQANYIFKYNVDYTVRDEDIVLIDVFTGRLLEGRQFSEGLNQAIEAKEKERGVEIKPETKINASVTYQNLFRMYSKLSGMSGTAMEEQEEFLQVYNMRVIPIPTNLPVIREDEIDIIFATKKAKFDHLINEIKRIHDLEQPILVGTRSVDDSEMVAKTLEKLKIEHEVLNAKNHTREADIVSKAGNLKAITISTNMAGRGTDIKLGKGVIELGGLKVIGTERHESRRIDNQLRGRSGRQGDIGASQFLISLEDEIVIRSGMTKFTRWTDMIDANPLESKSLTRALTSAQKKIEGLNYDQRKSVIEYEDVGNTQRLITYKQRDAILVDKKIKETIVRMINSFVEQQVQRPYAFVDDLFSSEALIKHLNRWFNFDDKRKIKQFKGSQKETIEYLKVEFERILNEKIGDLEKDGVKINSSFKSFIISAIDNNWINHLEKIQKLKAGIRYRQYAQKNPVQIFVLESTELFNKYKELVIEHSMNIILRQMRFNVVNPTQQKHAMHTNIKIQDIKEVKEFEETKSPKTHKTPPKEQFKTNKVDKVKEIKVK